MNVIQFLSFFKSPLLQFDISFQVNNSRFLLSFYPKIANEYCKCNKKFLLRMNVLLESVIRGNKWKLLLHSKNIWKSTNSFLIFTLTIFLFGNLLINKMWRRRCLFINHMVFSRSIRSFYHFHPFITIQFKISSTFAVSLSFIQFSIERKKIHSTYGFSFSLNCSYSNNPIGFI